MLYYLQSTDPNNYGTIQFHADPNMGHPTKVMMRVRSINTYANFALSTKVDYTTFKAEKEPDVYTPSHEELFLTYYFEDKCKYDEHNYLDYLQKNVFTQDEKPTITVNQDPFGRIKLSITSENTDTFKIVDASHRAMMLLGMYNSKLPLVFDKDGEYFSLTMPSTPYLSFGNELFLRSSLSSISGFNNIAGVKNSTNVMYRSV
ncbi:hypothetical protein TVAGG3_0209410 [Trichomonas vaginalis G3]|uniref:hypothetical protein n=1 Tax=Trichomonas vaginalis (strain ATCC PRA-98 / G3) TaxID=412133 RepID=UPI0021E5DBD3|nr:hypothetical protein TVAGG3_0209410 [Trichomonas vaginalis G3]KAI5551130.1 hypothetical protein TVAGG3_0209410 [Trichomonas vaginalis G3]